MLTRKRNTLLTVTLIVKMRALIFRKIVMGNGLTEVWNGKRTNKNMENQITEKISKYLVLRFFCESVE